MVVYLFFRFFFFFLKLHLTIPSSDQLGRRALGGRFLRNTLDNYRKRLKRRSANVKRRRYASLVYMPRSLVLFYLFTGCGCSDYHVHAHKPSTSIWNEYFLEQIEISISCMIFRFLFFTICYAFEKGNWNTKLHWAEMLQSNYLLQLNIWPLLFNILKLLISDSLFLVPNLKDWFLGFVTKIYIYIYIMMCMPVFWWGFFFSWLVSFFHLFL